MNLNGSLSLEEFLMTASKDHFGGRGKRFEHEFLDADNDGEATFDEIWNQQYNLYYQMNMLRETF